MCDLFIGTLIYIFKLGISKSVNQVHHLQLQSLFFSTLHFMITIIIFFSSFFCSSAKNCEDYTSESIYLIHYSTHICDIFEAIYLALLPKL